jgi:xanthosine utilization system XapX-like protein
MANKFGPTRGELWFRLVAGIVGFAVLIAAVTARGVPSGPALVEVVGFGGVFFGGTVLWSAWQLWKGRAE